MSPASSPDIEPIADEIFRVLGSGRQVQPFTARVDGFDLASAFRTASRVRAARIGRGERVVGRKIGFTNRTIWAEYDVWAPIWGEMYDSTVRDLPQPPTTASLKGLAEPRIEPEIVFGIGRAPAAGMDESALLDCIDWIAHGFEIVQSIYPAWKFAAPDTVAAYGLHGALWIGPRHPVAPRRDAWLATLSAFEIELCCNDEVIDRGRASNVLDGPLSALRHLVEGLARDPEQPPLVAGEIVTTGTLTRAMPVVPGQTWSTRLSGIALPGNRITFS